MITANPLVIANDRPGPPSQYVAHCTAIAKETHRLLNRAATERGLARTRSKGIDGRIIPTTIASFIWAASSSIGGDPIDTRDVDLIRHYLKMTKNVWSLGSIASTGKYRIFVADEWADMAPTSTTTPREPDAIDRRAAKLTPEEAGETREPAPVKITRPGTEYVYDETRLKILRHLAIHGRMENPNDTVTYVVMEALGIEDTKANRKKVSGDLKHMANRDLIGRDMHHSRSTRAIWLTDHGKELLDAAIERGHLDPIEVELDDNSPMVEVEEEVITYDPAKAKGVTAIPTSDYDKALAVFGADLTDRLDTLARVLVEQQTVHHIDVLAEEIRKILAMDLTPIQMLAAIEEEING